MFCFQGLDLQINSLTSLPDHLSNLGKLKNLLLTRNKFQEVPVSALRGLTALRKVKLGEQVPPGAAPIPGWICKVTSSLLPIIHPGLVKLDLRQDEAWDSVSLFHLGGAMAAVANRTPHLELLF